MDSNQIVKHYHGNSITFLNKDSLMVNATEMAKAFGKRVSDWLNNQSTKEFLDALTVTRKSVSADFQAVKVVKGGIPELQGTWLHQDAALEFARWLSPKFAIWCNDKIKELMLKGYTCIDSLSVPSYQISDPIKRAEKWIEEEKQRQQLAIENKTKQKKIEEQQHTIEQKDSTISDQKKQIEESQPAVTFTNAVSGSKSACLIGELAKLICQNGVQIGQNRLFEWLRKNHYLGSVGERRNIPNQEYIEQGLFIVKKGVRTGNDGVLYTTKTTKVTGKGQIYFINKFLQNKNNEAH